MNNPMKSTPSKNAAYDGGPIRGTAFVSFIALVAFAACTSIPSTNVTSAERVTVNSHGWKLVGDLVVPRTGTPAAAALLLNKAADNRTVYVALADELARRGIASLRLDLRAHGESTNLGRFDPAVGTAILEGSDQDVVAAVGFLKADPRIDSNRIGLVGASYSGEVMMEAARQSEYATAYVALSPGSLSDQSIAAIDANAVPFLLVVSRHERHLTEVVRAFRAMNRSADFLELSGTEHATRLLPAHPGLAGLIAEWLSRKLGPH